MFDRLKRLWKGIVNMFSYTTFKNILGKDVALTQAMIDAINDWKNMLSGKADWCESYVESLRLEEGICREFADAALVEMEMQILNNEQLDKTLKKAAVDLNKKMQNGLALGSLVLRPLGPDKFEYITADKMIPISFDDDGKPNDIAFLSVKRVGENNYYFRLERHYFTNGNLTIENNCYHSQSRSDIGQRCELENVPEWANIQPGPIIYPGMTQMDFGYYQNPVENKIDESGCGVSIYESAIGLIRKADRQAARLDWEYESGERAIHVDERALKHSKGKTYLPKLSNRLYRGLNLDDGKDKELFKEYSPQMRDEAYKRGLEECKREIEFNVGLAYGDLSDVQNVEKTATEVLTSKTRKYNRVTAIQNNLEKCLQDFVQALAFYNGCYMSGIEFACKFKDSILTDEESERQQDRQDVSMGAMSLLEYRMKWYNEDEETARAKLPEQNQVME
ncbi:MAG: phage capsid protein [Anaerostipes hadrus]